MDTEPLQSPTRWITETDLTPWRDYKTHKLYESTVPVHAIVGIEADTDPDRDTYWRMGYFFPVQLTQWSFAFAPHHPILQIFIDRLCETVQLFARNQSTSTPLDPASEHEPILPGHGLDWVDPVNLTGPIAFTDSVKTYLQDKADLRWNAVTGLKDGGASKLVEDVLVLPITGFRYSLQNIKTRYSANVFPAPAPRGSKTWARNPSRTARRGSSTMPRARGANGVSRWRLASSAGRRLGCARTGRRCRMGIIGYGDYLDNLMCYELDFWYSRE